MWPEKSPGVSVTQDYHGEAFQAQTPITWVAEAEASLA